jgi:hypothetical protein
VVSSKKAFVIMCLILRYRFRPNKRARRIKIAQFYGLRGCKNESVERIGGGAASLLNQIQPILVWLGPKKSLLYSLQIPCSLYTQ